jgi:tetratricopeptide (TPR) repeat protein
MPTQQLPEDQLNAHKGAGAVERGASGSRWPRMFAALLSERWLVRIALLLLLGLYLRSIGFAPVYDDNLIGEWGKLSDIPKFFAHDIFGSDGTAHSVYYRPLNLTFIFLWSYITGGAPGWLHLGAILLHLASVILAYDFGRHLFRDDRMALLTAVLFGLHPSKVESVAWIGSGFVEGLGAVFFFATLIAFLKWRETDSGRWLAGSVFLFACALLTKETMLVILMLIAVHLWLTTPAEGRIARTLRTLLPYGLVLVAFMAVRHQVIKPAGPAVEYVHPTYSHANLWTAPYATWWYISHLTLPWGLSVEYAPKIVESSTLLGFVLPAAALLLLLAVALWLWNRRRSPIAAFLMCWFAVTLAPPVILATMVQQHDRYLYLTSYAFCALIAWAILYLGTVPAAVRAAVALCVVVLWSGLTWHEMGYWDCDKTLWGRALEISPSNLKAQLQLAFIYDQEGDTPKALGVLDAGLRGRPNTGKLWMTRAEILYYHNRYDEARPGYLKVMQLTEPPAGHAVEIGLPTRLRSAAAYRLAELDILTRNFTEAESYMRTALSLEFKGVNYHSTLSRVLAAEGRTGEAKAENDLELQLRMEQLSKATHRHP